MGSVILKNQDEVVGGTWRAEKKGLQILALSKLGGGIRGQLYLTEGKCALKTHRGHVDVLEALLSWASPNYNKPSELGGVFFPFSEDRRKCGVIGLRHRQLGNLPVRVRGGQRIHGMRGTSRR